MNYRLNYFIISSLSSVALSACGSNSDNDFDAAPVANLGDASAGDAGEGASHGIVVLHSDYQSGAVSFLDRDGNLLKDSCFHSGSGAKGLNMTLSGDVTLPAQSPPGGPVVIIDRGNAVLTWLDPSTCAPLRQLAVGTGFAANPHDFVWLSASKAYVPRFGENLAATPAPDDFDEGSDLLIVDPTQPKIVGRIDLKPFVPAGANMLPLADRALLVGGMVYVSLNAISGDWSSYGVGRILMVDPTIDQVVGFIDTPGAKNCGAMSYLAAENKLLVACTGDRNAGAQQVDTSALVVIDLGATPPAVVAQVGAAALGGLHFANCTVAALDGNTLLGVTEGDFSDTPPDQLWSFSLSGAPATMVFASAEAFSLGAILVDVEKQQFILADGPHKKSASLRVFDFAAGILTSSRTIQSNPSHNLPAAALGWY